MFEISGSVNDSENRNATFARSVNQAVVSDKDLPDLGIVSFWYDAATLPKQSQTPGCGLNLPNKGGCVETGVARYELGDTIQVIERRGRPTLRREPLRKAGLRILVAQNVARLNFFQGSLNLLSNVDVVLNVLEGSVVRDLLEQLLDFVFRRVHDSPILRHHASTHRIALRLKIKVVVHEAEEGGYWAEVPAIPGCASQGETLDELLENVHEAVEGCVAADVEASASET